MSNPFDAPWYPGHSYGQSGPPRGGEPGWWTHRPYNMTAVGRVLWDADQKLETLRTSEELEALIQEIGRDLAALGSHTDVEPYVMSWLQWHELLRPDPDDKYYASSKTHTFDAARLDQAGLFMKGLPHWETMPYAGRDVSHRRWQWVDDNGVTHIVGCGSGAHGENAQREDFRQIRQRVRACEGGACQHAMARAANILDPVQDQLDPTIFIDSASPEPVLKPEIRKWIYDVIYKALEQAGYDGMEEWLSLVLTGSLTTYQYSERSDCDVSLFVDVPKLPEWSRAEMIGIMVENCDGQLVPGTTHPLQVFVVDTKKLSRDDLYQPGLRSGYDLATQRWIVPPDPERVQDVQAEQYGDYFYALEVADKLDRLLTFEPEKAKLYYQSIHRRRQQDQLRGRGDFSQSNIVYKMLDQKGLFDRLRSLGVKIAGLTTQSSARMLAMTEDDPSLAHYFETQEHDYDPRWDYEVVPEHYGHPLHQLAQRRLDELAARPDTPFERGHVHPARLDATKNPSGQNAVGVYCSGTYNEPVVMVDIDAHHDPDVISPEDEIRRTVDHEARHAVQEWQSEGNDGWADEDDAEGHVFG